MASEHFERQIEPLLSPPRTFIGTKVLDLFASSSELQCEESIAVFYNKIAESFPKSHPYNININTWLARLRSEIIHKNIQLIFKASRQSERDIMCSKLKLRWYSSQYDNYRSNINLCDITEQKEDSIEMFKDIESDESNDNLDTNERSENTFTPSTTQISNIVGSSADVFNEIMVDDSNDNTDCFNDNLLSIITNNNDIVAVNNPTRKKKIKKKNRYEIRNCIVENEHQILEQTNVRASRGDATNNFAADINLVRSLVNQKNPLNFMKNVQRTCDRQNKHEKSNGFKLPNGYLHHESRTKKMLAEAEALLNTTRLLASQSKSLVTQDKNQDVSNTPSYGHYNLELLLKTINDETPINYPSNDSVNGLINQYLKYEKDGATEFTQRSCIRNVDSIIKKLRSHNREKKYQNPP